MNDGYVNEGGQLKSKNGQKYTINARRRGVYVPRYCVLLTVLLGVAAMIVIALLSYFLLSQPSSGGASTGDERQTAAVAADVDVRNASNRFDGAGDGGGDDKLAGLFYVGDSDDRRRNNSDLTTSSALDVATASTIIDAASEILLSTTTEGNAVGNSASSGENEAIVSVEGWLPQLYRLVIEPDFEATLSNGSVSIEVTEDALVATKAQAPLPIVLDITNITILRASVTANANGVDQPIGVATSYGPRNETYVLRILESLPIGHDNRTAGLTVHLDFVSRLSDTLTGFYKTAYRANGVERVMASTQFSPVNARRAFPCFDRPGLKARFEISVVRHRNYSMALSNMPSIRTSVPRPDYVREDFNVTPRMSTYLVAFVVSNLVNASVEETINAPHLPAIRVWTRPQYQDQTQFIYTMTRRMMSFLDRYFGIPIGLPKIDLVAVPDFGFSAMENWGLITFRESGLLVDPAEENRSVIQTISVCKTLGHEIAHQWFGNLVTMRWWNDLWLKEGFATYLSYVTLETVQPSWRLLDYFGAHELQEAMRADSDESAHPISFPVNSSADVWRMFDPISYSKGAAIVSMLNGILGDRTFRAVLQDYLRLYRYANAEQDDLWRVMTKKAHLYQSLPLSMDIKTIMDTWTLQAGYPVLLVTRDANVEGTVHFTQHPFRLPHANATGTVAKSGPHWYVPITFATSGHRTHDTRPQHWLLPEPDARVTLHNLTTGSYDWLYANVQRLGYYRVNYDHNSWLALSINYVHLPAVTRGAMLDDALALAQAELLTYDVPLTLLRKLAIISNEDRVWGAVPLASAESGLRYVTDMISREPANDSWRTLLRYVLKPMFEQIGFMDVESDTLVEKAHRVRVVSSACEMGLERCVNRAVMLFKDWMEGGKSVHISPGLQSTILCTALRQGGAKEWHFVYELYLNQSTASEKEVLLNALGCTAKPWLLSKYLNMTLSASSGIRKQDGYRALHAIARNPAGNELAFDFLSTNIVQFSKYYGEGFSTISRMIGATTAFANQPVQLAKYEAFAADAHRLRLSSIETSIRLLLPKVRNNVYWRQHRYSELDKFLQSLVQFLETQVA